MPDIKQEEFKNLSQYRVRKKISRTGKNESVEIRSIDMKVQVYVQRSAKVDPQILALAIADFLNREWGE